MSKADNNLEAKAIAAPALLRERVGLLRCSHPVRWDSPLTR